MPRYGGRPNLDMARQPSALTPDAAPREWQPRGRDGPSKRHALGRSPVTGRPIFVTQCEGSFELWGSPVPAACSSHAARGYCPA